MAATRNLNKAAIAALLPSASAHFLSGLQKDIDPFVYFQALVVMYAPLSAMYILNFSSSEFKVIKRVGENSINIEIQIRL